MSKCDITVTMPIEEYEKLKSNAEWQEKRFKDLFNNINKHFDVDENGEVTKYNEVDLYKYLKTTIYEVKYDL